MLALLVLGCNDSAPPPAPDAVPGRDAVASERGSSSSAGSERMVRRLALLADQASLESNPFLNRQRLERLQALTLPDDPRDRLRGEIELAVELLRAGDSAAAIERLQQALVEAERDPSVHPPGLARRLRSRLAVAHLRLGEQQNCVDQHTIDSCLMPIREGGIHRLPEGSRAAISVYAELLHEDPEDLTSRWLYNLASMTLGEYPDQVPAAWRIPESAFASEADIGRFPDVAMDVGLATVGAAGGLVVDDLDGDGYLDVVVSSWGLRDPLRFFRNRRDGTFEERTREAGLTGQLGGLNLTHADYDNDGDLDILVLRGGWLSTEGRHPNSLLANDGTGVFEDVTEQAGLLSFHPTQTAAWGDFDNDGWLDLYIGNESSGGERHPCELYRNLGRGLDGVVRFEEIAAAAGVEAGGVVKGVVWGDVDNDGWLDLYLSRLSAPNLLFINQGAASGAEAHPVFVDEAARAGVQEPLESFPTWFFDFDHDGWLDLFVGGYANSFVGARADPVIANYLGRPASALAPRLYRNQGDGTFRDVTAEAGLQRALLGMAANFGDLDNDGQLDFYIGTGAPDFRALVPNRMFRYDGEGRFQDVTTSGGFGHLQKGHGIAFVDLDNDGDQDVLAVMGGAFEGDVYANVVFANPGHGNRWITLRLEGTDSNRSAIGARLRLELETPAGTRERFAVVGSGGSFGSSSLQQELGLGDATALPLLEITWPGGAREVVRDLPLERIVRVRQGDPEVQVLELERLSLGR
ncbi:MAG: CRTAC1 family protein [Acidobacteriota bacterium]